MLTYTALIEAGLPLLRAGALPAAWAPVEEPFWEPAEERL